MRFDNDWCENEGWSPAPNLEKAFIALGVISVFALGALCWLSNLVVR